MTDRERGGFYASQTLTSPRRRRRATLEDSEDRRAPRSTPRSWECCLELIRDMLASWATCHHNPGKNVLHVKQALDEKAEGGDFEVIALRCALAA